MSRRRSSRPSDAPRATSDTLPPLQLLLPMTTKTVEVEMKRREMKRQDTL
jgi:hypothetical protein